MVGMNSRRYLELFISQPTMFHSSWLNSGMIFHSHPLGYVRAGGWGNQIKCKISSLRSHCFSWNFYHFFSWKGCFKIYVFWIWVYSLFKDRQLKCSNNWKTNKGTLKLTLRYPLSDPDYPQSTFKVIPQ